MAGKGVLTDVSSASSGSFRSSAGAGVIRKAK